MRSWTACAASRGSEELLDDPRFATPQARAEHAGEFGAVLRETMRTRTADQWEQELSAAHVPATRVRSVPEVLAEPHLQQRQVQQQVVDPITGATLNVPSIGFKWNGQALGPWQAPPRLGQHTKQLLSELGLTQADEDRLLGSGGAGSRPFRLIQEHHRATCATRGQAMSATTIRIDEDLKARLASAAEKASQSTHAFIQILRMRRGCHAPHRGPDPRSHPEPAQQSAAALDHLSVGSGPCTCAR